MCVCARERVRVCVRVCACVWAGDVQCGMPVDASRFEHNQEQEEITARRGISKEQGTRLHPRGRYGRGLVL